MWELSSGVNVPITEEESVLVDKFLDEVSPTLTEREEVVAQNLVRKDVLLKDDNLEQVYRLNYLADIWRD